MTAFKNQGKKTKNPALDNNAYLVRFFMEILEKERKFMKFTSPIRTALTCVYHCCTPAGISAKPSFFFDLTRLRKTELDRGCYIYIVSEHQSPTPPTPTAYSSSSRCKTFWIKGRNNRLHFVIPISIVSDHCIR